jgi:hypothetical protein
MSDIPSNANAKIVSSLLPGTAVPVKEPSVRPGAASIEHHSGTQRSTPRHIVTLHGCSHEHTCRPFNRAACVCSSSSSARTHLGQVSLGCSHSKRDIQQLVGRSTDSACHKAWRRQALCQYVAALDIVAAHTFAPQPRSHSSNVGGCH